MKQAKAVRNFLIGESVLILLAAAVLWRGGRKDSWMRERF